jgi:2-dehydro-3-deoxyglucarate aldolase/4-hydroxy-2-oxoheptanedioate aldolase
MITPLDNGRFRERLRAREKTVGIFAGLGSPMAAEVAAAAGVDWVLVDGEHGAASDDVVSATVVATGGYGVPTLVRVESAERIRIGRALDAGAAGVMIPRAESAEDVRLAIRHFDYPPVGDRGVATYNRAARWGMDADALSGERRAAAIIQIETAGALGDVEEIAGIPGVDLLFVGPLDLSYSLGIPGQFDHPDFVAALERVVRAGVAAGVPTGILAPTVEAARAHRARGFQFIALSSDSVLLATTIQSSLAAITKEKP